MKATLKQQNEDILNELSRWEGFNNFDPPQAVKIIRKIKKHWSKVIWQSGYDDTLYLVPKKNRVSELECLLAGYMMGADEVHLEPQGHVRIWFD